MNHYKVPKEEKEFLIKNCPVKINKNSFKKYHLYTIAKELETGREILFYKFQDNFITVENIGKLMLFASGINTDILLVFVKKKSMELTQLFDWLGKNQNKKFILK